MANESKKQYVIKGKIVGIKQEPVTCFTFRLKSRRKRGKRLVGRDVGVSPAIIFNL